MSAGVSPIHVQVVSETGKVRKDNQDAYFVGPHPSERQRSHGTLILVADGMGGHAAGSVASTLAVETIFSSYYTEPIGPGESPTTAFKRSFQAANMSIIEAGRRDHSHFGMGTTCSGLLIRGGEAWVCHVGDSRVYRYRDGGLERLTRDHTLLQRMLDRGEVKAEDAGSMPVRHILVRAMGSEQRVEVACPDEPIALRPGDRFLLSSDGLHDLLDESVILDVLADSADDKEALRRLAAEADAAGSPDNVTAILVHWPGNGDAEHG